jgi:hypothetical protein
LVLEVVVITLSIRDENQRKRVGRTTFIAGAHAIAVTAVADAEKMMLSVDFFCDVLVNVVIEMLQRKNSDFVAPNLKKL